MNATPPPLPVSHAATTPLRPWLARYISHKRRFLVALGLAGATGLLLLAGLSASLLDQFFGLPAWARWIALAACAAGFASLAFRSVHQATTLRRRQAMADIESLLPAQGQLLRTALEESESTRPRSPTHDLLAQALIRQAGALAHRFHPGKQLPWGRVKARWLGLAAATAITLGMVAVWPDFRTAVRRLIQPSAGLTFTRLQFINPPESIIAGDEGHVSVRVSGRRAAPPVLTVQRGEVRDAPALMARDPENPHTYSLSLGKPGATVRVQAIAGDGSTSWLTIPVVYPPKLRDLTAELTYPEYTGLEPATQKSADIEAVEGTRVTVTLVTDRPIARGHIAFSDGTTLPVDLKESTVSFTAPLNRGSLTWKLDAHDSRGLALGGAGGKWIGLDDKPPKIEWVTPKDDIEATPLAEVTLRAKAKDDFGLLETGLIIQTGGLERVLHTENFDAAQGVPVTAVLEALAEIERENVGIRDNVKVFAYARDRFPAPGGRERRGVSDLRNIDIRQFKVWRSMAPSQAGGAQPMPRAQQALMKLEELIKSQRGIVNEVFRLKEENVQDAVACGETAARQRPLGEAAADLKSALDQSEQPPPADDLALLDTAAIQMDEAATALEQPALPPAFANADGALTSLLELRREIMKILGGQGQGNPANSKPDDFQLPSLAALAKEAERLSEEERLIANAAPQTKENSVEGERLASRQTTAQADAGELFDSIVTHPEVTALAQSRMGDAEDAMAQATRTLRDRQPDSALPPLQEAQESLAHLAQHLRGLEAAQAANTLKQASDMARQSANDLRQPDEGKQGPSDRTDNESTESSQASADSAAPPGSPNGSSPAGEGASPGGSPGESPGAGSPSSTANRTPRAATAPSEAPGSSPEQRAAEQAATINDWLQHLARQESLGRTAERLGTLQRESDTEKLAAALATRAAETKENPDAAADSTEADSLARQLESLAESLAAEHQRMVQGTLEKLAAAQAATRAMQAARSGSQPSPSGRDASAAGRAGSPGDNQSPGESPGSGRSSAGPPGGPGGPGSPNAAVRPNTGQGWGVTAPGSVSNALPGTLRFAQDLADLLKEFQDTQLTELSDALIRQLAEAGYNRNVDAETLGIIDARLEALIQEVIQRQWLAGKSDRVPTEFEARVERYFRRLSEDTGEEEEDLESIDEPDAEAPEDATNDRRRAIILEEPPALEQPPSTPAPFSPDFDSPNLRLIPEQ
jgi:hypothetical protein